MCLLLNLSRCLSRMSLPTIESMERVVGEVRWDVVWLDGGYDRLYLTLTRYARKCRKAKLYIFFWVGVSNYNEVFNVSNMEI